MAPSDDAQGEIILLVSNFARELATFVEGTPDEDGIHQAIRPLNRTFISAIRSTTQKFSPFERKYGKSYTPPTFLPSEEQGVDGGGTDGMICLDEVMNMADR